MLTITIPAAELWDEKNEVFINTPGATIQLEHSLVSISKWEAKWHKAFLGKKEKTEEEVLDYVRFHGRRYHYIIKNGSSVSSYKDVVTELAAYYDSDYSASAIGVYRILGYK